MQDVVKVALIGCGKMGAHHLKELSHVKTPHKIVGFFDVFKSNAEKLSAQWGAPVFDSITEMCQQSGADVVHICTPPDFHFDNAMEALGAGTSIYVEKPFVQTIEEAKIVAEKASQQNLKMCAGFQQLYDPAYLKLLSTSESLGGIQAIESRFAFRPARFSVNQATPKMLGDQLLDILPHPLYTLVDAVEKLMPGQLDELELEYFSASSSEVYGVFLCGSVRCILDVSLTKRPVESVIKVSAENGTYSADFVRGITHGTANDGTQALEKILNPAVEGVQLQARSMLSLAKRLLGGESYPGLARLFDRYYQSIATHQDSPISPEQILKVVQLYEVFASKVYASVKEDLDKLDNQAPAVADDARTVLVTGAGGMLGSQICEDLVKQNFRVVAVGRTDKSAINPSHRWVSADLSQGLPPEVLQDVDLIIHAAAETSGGYEEHQRNSIDATNKLLEQAKAAGVAQFLFVSSLAVLEPRWWRAEPLTESSPRVADPRSMGPYIWGKYTSEIDVENRAKELGIEYRIVRPAALVDYTDSLLPGRLGKKLFGRWYLCLGRGGLPFTACDVDTAARVIADYAVDFENKPELLNLIDGSIESRRELLQRYRARGWKGRSLWVPISVLASAIWSAKSLIAMLKRDKSEKVSAWKVLKPRSYDSKLAMELISNIK